MDVAHAGHRDAYVRPGDPVGLRHMCCQGTGRIFGPAHDLPMLVPYRVELAGRVLPRPGEQAEP